MPRAVRHVILVATVLAGAAGPVSAQTTDDLFNPFVLHEVRLFIHPNDWKTLQANYIENTYYQADFVWRNQTVASVGIRSRGNGSRNSIKPGLRVDFNRYIDGQTLLGLKSLVLDNKTQDPSFLEEHMSMRLFTRYGIPAPRESFCKLYVNNQYWGLYSLVESVDKDFLKRTLGENDGYLYEYRWGSEYFLEDLGDDPINYVPLPFKPETHESSPDVANLMAMIRTVNQASDEAFERRAGEFLDLSQVTMYLAIEVFLSETDGFAGTWGANNFYLYQRTGSKQFVLIPWDKDSTFWDFDHPITYNLGKNVLSRRLLSIPTYAQLYLDTLRALSNEAAGEGQWMLQEANAALELIREAASQDPNMPYTVGEFQADAGWVFEFLKTRGSIVLRQIDYLLNPPQPIQEEPGMSPGEEPVVGLEQPAPENPEEP